MAKFNLPEDRTIAQKILENETKRSDLGWLGIIFGSRDNAKFNVASLISIIIVFVLSFSVLFLSNENAVDNAMKALIAAFFSIVGFLVGSRIK